MLKLILSAPQSQAQGGKRSFDSTVTLSIGDSYGISRKNYEKLSEALVKGNPVQVIVLCKDGKRQAEGLLVKLVRTIKPFHDLQRYDVHIKNLKIVPFTGAGIALTRKGVTV